MPISSTATGSSFTALTVIDKFPLTDSGPPDPVPPKSFASTRSCTSPLKCSFGINVRGLIAFETSVINPEKINVASEFPSPKLKVNPSVEPKVIKPLSTES